MGMCTPDWVKHAVFYQIFPDRFARSPRLHHPPSLRFKLWGAPPEEQGFQGGDLLGIVDRLDYLQTLGVNALYLTPVFASASNHRYHTYDFMQVDPLLGGDAALRELLDAAHARQMRVVLDGVFNHASRGFWAFHHILETGKDSPYIDWFIVRDWPLRPYHSDELHPLNYLAWWGLPALPKFNHANPDVQCYLLDVARHWIEFGADGWRLDVPGDIEDESFWRRFRDVVKRANPEAYITGEIWHEAQSWLQGDKFDAVMNYVFSRLALGFFGAGTLRTAYRPGGHKLERLKAHRFAQAVERMLALYDWEVNLAQLNLLDSHDTSRALWMMGDDESAQRLCVLFQMTMPGAPCIYYGDEIGMSAGHEPACRAAFPWSSRDQWNLALLEFYHRAVHLRRSHAVLRTGAFQTLVARGAVYGFGRVLDGQVAVILFNVGLSPLQVNVKVSGIAHEGDRFGGVWNSGQYEVDHGRLRNVDVPPRDAVVLLKEAR